MITTDWQPVEWKSGHKTIVKDGHLFMAKMTYFGSWEWFDTFEEAVAWCEEQEAGR